LVLRVSDGDGRVLSQSKPSKIDMKPGPDFRTGQWELPVPPQPGSYRIEVSLDEAIMWRGFVSVTSDH
jgi:hypothetical protein